MKEVLITFLDGTTELRPEWTPCIMAFGRDMLPRAPHLAAYANLSDGLCIDGRTPSPISSVRFPLVFGRYQWRITGQDIATKTLIGEWCEAHVETTDEQIERLTRERDAALARAVAAEARLPPPRPEPKCKDCDDTGFAQDFSNARCWSCGPTSTRGEP